MDKNMNVNDIRKKRHQEEKNKVLMMVNDMKNNKKRVVFGHHHMKGGVLTTKEGFNYIQDRLHKRGEEVVQLQKKEDKPYKGDIEGVTNNSFLETINYLFMKITDAVETRSINTTTFEDLYKVVKILATHGYMLSKKDVDSYIQNVIKLNDMTDLRNYRNPPQKKKETLTSIRKVIERIHLILIEISKYSDLPQHNRKLALRDTLYNMSKDFLNAEVNEEESDSDEDATADRVYDSEPDSDSSDDSDDDGDSGGPSSYTGMRRFTDVGAEDRSTVLPHSRSPYDLAAVSLPPMPAYTGLNPFAHLSEPESSDDETDSRKGYHADPSSVLSSGIPYSRNPFDHAASISTSDSSFSHPGMARHTGFSPAGLEAVRRDVSDLAARRADEVSRNESLESLSGYAPSDSFLSATKLPSDPSSMSPAEMLSSSRYGDSSTVEEEAPPAPVIPMTDEERLDRVKAMAKSFKDSDRVKEDRIAEEPQSSKRDFYKWYKKISGVKLEGAELDQAFTDSYLFSEFMRRHQDEEEDKAKKIQAAVRGTLARKKTKQLLEAKKQEEDFKKVKDATVSIQAAVRGKLARKKTIPLLEQARKEADEIINDKAKTIQAAVRGKLARKKTGQLLDRARKKAETDRAYIDGWRDYKAEQIQAVVRGNQARKVAKQLKEQKEIKRINDSATKVQALFKGAKTRKKHLVEYKNTFDMENEDRGSQLLRSLPQEKKINFIGDKVTPEEFNDIPIPSIPKTKADFLSQISSVDRDTLTTLANKYGYYPHASSDQKAVSTQLAKILYDPSSQSKRTKYATSKAVGSKASAASTFKSGPLPAWMREESAAAAAAAPSPVAKHTRKRDKKK
jgi:hypothetical protein